MKKHNHQSSVGPALKFARQAQGLTQEAFDVKSSRVYISAVERGIKTPTLSAVDKFSAVLGLHPLTLLTLCYLNEVEHSSTRDVDELLSAVRDELVRLIPHQID